MVFFSFSWDFRVSVGIKNHCFLGGFPGHFPKKGKEGQGFGRLRQKIAAICNGEFWYSQLVSHSRAHFRGQTLGDSESQKKKQIFAENPGFFAQIHPSILEIGDRDSGGQNVPGAGGGGIRTESCPSKTWTFDPQVGDFL